MYLIYNKAFVFQLIFLAYKLFFTYLQACFLLTFINIRYKNKQYTAKVQILFKITFFINKIRQKSA